MLLTSISLANFAPNHVAREEMKMDHFEQGLKGNVKSMIAGHKFDSYQEMYQSAIKISRILDETKGENRAIRQMKQKFECGRSIGQGSGNWKRGNYKGP